MKQLLSLFNLRGVEIKLYQTLFYGGIMSASQLAKQAGISRTSAYGLLDHLIETGLVTESSKVGIKIFAVQPPKKIELLLNEKSRSINSAARLLEQMQTEYSSQEKTKPPRLQLFEGRKELQQMMKDMLLYRDMTVLACWPVITIMKLLTPEFTKKFHKQRIERNIELKTIWTKNQIPNTKKHRLLRPIPKLKRQVRVAPKGFNQNLGCAIYQNTVRFISSEKENFGFLVESQELTELMTCQFQVLWQASKPYK